ncbi:hypothetical protein L7F22_064955 [Adiantum nelumboides]|nr:hypothetical protein [Adiantum nelumboides]
MYITNGSKRIGDLDLWHKRCGHINTQRLKYMEKRQVVSGLPHFSLQMLHEMCEACQLGKSSRQPFKQSNYVLKGLLDLVHTDDRGPTREALLARNRYTPQQNKVAKRRKTPEEVWSGKKPNLSYLKFFGCVCYMHVPRELRGKMDARAKKCIFIEYSLEKKGYRCFNPNTKQLQVSRDVVFDKLKSWYRQKSMLQDADMEEAKKQHEASQQESLEERSPSNNGSSSIKGKATLVEIDDDDEVTKTTSKAKSPRQKRYTPPQEEVRKSTKVLDISEKVEMKKLHVAELHTKAEEELGCTIAQTLKRY